MALAALVVLFSLETRNRRWTFGFQHSRHGHGSKGLWLAVPRPRRACRDFGGCRHGVCASAATQTGQQLESTEHGCDGQLATHSWLDTTEPMKMSSPSPCCEYNDEHLDSVQVERRQSRQKMGTSSAWSIRAFIDLACWLSHWERM